MIEESQLAKLIEDAREMEARAGADLHCDIRLGPGDWGGQNVVVAVSQDAAIHLARQLLQLASRNAPGAHFHIDKASIAPDTDHQLIFTRE